MGFSEVWAAQNRGQPQVFWGTRPDSWNVEVPVCVNGLKVVEEMGYRVQKAAVARFPERQRGELAKLLTDPHILSVPKTMQPKEIKEKFLEAFAEYFGGIEEVRKEMAEFEIDEDFFDEHLLLVDGPETVTLFFERVGGFYVVPPTM